MIGGKRVGVRLELGGGIDDGIRAVVVLNDIQHVLDGIARRLQALDLPADFRHGTKHAEKPDGALLHHSGGVSVESERRRGGDKWNPQLLSDEFAPNRHRIRDDAIRRKGAHVAENRAVQRQRRIDEHAGGKGQIAAQPFAILRREALLSVIAVAGDERCARGFDGLAHRVVGIIDDVVAARDQLADNAQRRIGVAIGRNTEKDDCAHAVTFFEEDYSRNG